MKVFPGFSEKKNLTILCLVSLAFIAVTIFVRIRLADVPLERDEGEYAYMGQLLLQGIPPYASAYTMKLPGTAMVYAMLMAIFGETATGIRIGFIFVNGASAFMVYLLGGRLFSRQAGLIAASFFVLLSLSESVLGAFAHATHLVILFSLAGILLLWHGLERQHTVWVFVAGTFFGLSVLMKQHAAILVLFALVCQVLPGVRRGHRSTAFSAAAFLAGAAAPWCILALWLVNAGVFRTFWFWTVQYPREYTSEQSFAAAMVELKRQAEITAKTTLPIWLLACAGVLLLCRKAPTTTDRRFIFGYLAASVAMVCPGFYFRAHYFVLLLPAIAILAASFCTSLTSISKIQDRYRKAALPLLLALISMQVLYAERACNFLLKPEEVSRKIYSTNPFPEAVAVADYIRSQTTARDTVAILGSEPEILFYAGRHSATGHIYMYGLMEIQKYAERMQRQLISEIEAAAPAMIVVVGSPTSWLPRANSVNQVLLWGENYIPLRYQEVGIVEIFDDRPSRYIWGEAVDGYETEAPAYVSIFKRLPY